MKRLLVLLMVLMLPCCALGEMLRVYQDSGPEDRVKLRESPGGRVIGQYYNDVLATPLESQRGWTRISVSGREGWMMSEFLLPADEAWLEENDWRGQGMPGAVWEGEGGLLPVFSAPDNRSEVLLQLPSGYLEVLATVNEDWLHVRYTARDGEVTCGYASAWHITYTDNMSGADVDTGDADERLNLRDAPSTSARKAAELYSGTRVLFLFDDHVNGDGWSKVRVGELTGYVKSEYLNNASAGVLDFEPPLGLLPDGQPVQVLAVNGDEVLVQPLGSRSTKLISRRSISRYTPKSASTGAVTTGEVWLTDSTGKPLYALPAGHSVHIYGSRSSVTGQSAYGCIHTEDTHLYVDIQIPGTSVWTSGYVPVSCVRFDPLLLSPAPWQR